MKSTKEIQVLLKEITEKLDKKRKQRRKINKNKFLKLFKTIYEGIKQII
jgi:hypothetical protein